MTWNGPCVFSCKWSQKEGVAFFFKPYNSIDIVNTYNIRDGRLLALKELEHRKLCWKVHVLILKYDLGKSVSKEMWCKMADTKKNYFIIYTF